MLANTTEPSTQQKIHDKTIFLDMRENASKTAMMNREDEKHEVRMELMSMMHHWHSNERRNKGQQQNQTEKIGNKNFIGLCIIEQKRGEEDKGN
jgi:ribosome assembly protein YihI (activator of Der GTPase)